MPAQFSGEGYPRSYAPFTQSTCSWQPPVFAFTIFILFKLHPPAVRLFRRFGFMAFNGLYAAILIPSALWLPLTFLAVDRSSLVFLWAVRLVLFVIALASLALLFALLNLEPREPVLPRRLALAGCAAFCFQTVILDAVVWVAFFRL